MLLAHHAEPRIGIRVRASVSTSLRVSFQCDALSGRSLKTVNSVRKIGVTRFSEVQGFVSMIPGVFVAAITSHGETENEWRSRLVEIVRR